MQWGMKSQERQNVYSSITDEQIKSFIKNWKLGVRLKLGLLRTLRHGAEDVGEEFKVNVCHDQS